MFEPRSDWPTKIPRNLSIIDGMVIAVAIVTAQLGRFGASLNETVSGSDSLNYWTLTVGLGLAWWMSLGLARSRDIRVIGVGTDEYRRVLTTSLAVFGLLAIGSYALHLDTARGYVGIALPVGLALLLLSRMLFRKFLVAKRKEGQLVQGVVVLGSPSAVQHIHHSLKSAPEAGYMPLAAILPGFQLKSPVGEELPLPVASVSTDLEEIVATLVGCRADALIVTSGSALKTGEVRRLGWQLQAHGINMIMAPSLTDIAASRFHTQAISGFPLIHVGAPMLEGRSAVAKRSFDVVISGLLILAFAPLLVVLAALVKLGSPGPVFYWQERIGKDGKSFKMFKFRSMVVNADAQLTELLAAQGAGDKPLFKVDNDPRITPIGAFLRQYSLDELPQLFNVFLGDMSLVGPRPQREAEVELYDSSAHRRLMVKPGMSGLWQVSGRSNLTWEQSIRFDLYYVENWSLSGDLAILCKTFSAVLQKDGAV